MKRRTLLGLGILALALGLTACNGGKEKSAQGDSKQEADSGKGNEKANAKPNEDYFEWMGEDSIANLNEEGSKQKVIVIPKRAKSFDSGLGPDHDGAIFPFLSRSLSHLDSFSLQKILFLRYRSFSLRHPLQHFSY